MTIKGNRSDCTATALILPPVCRHSFFSPFVDLKHCCNESDMAIRQLKQPVSYWGVFHLCLCPSCWACWDDYKKPNGASFISIPSERFFVFFGGPISTDFLLQTHWCLNSVVFGLLCRGVLQQPNADRQADWWEYESFLTSQLSFLYSFPFESRFTQCWRGSGSTSMIRDRFFEQCPWDLLDHFQKCRT